MSYKNMIYGTNVYQYLTNYEEFFNQKQPKE